MKGYLLRAVVVSVAVLVVAFIALRVLSMAGDLADVPAIERPWLLAPALALYAATLLTYALLWRDITGRLDRVRPPVIDSVAVFCASWLGRYVPSSLVYVAGKFAMGRRLGHSGPALAAAVLYENVLVVSVAAVSSSVLIPLTLAGDGGGLLVYLGAGLGGCAALALLSPGILRRAISAAAGIAGREAVSKDQFLSYRGVLAGSGIAAVGLAFNGAGFALLLNAFVELNVRELVASAAILNLAGAAGIAVLPVPSGLGVREVVLIALLQLIVPIEIAAAAAVVARLGSVAVELLFGVPSAALYAWRQSRPGLERAPPAPQRPQVEVASTERRAA